MIGFNETAFGCFAENFSIESMLLSRFADSAGENISRGRSDITEGFREILIVVIA